MSLLLWDAWIGLCLVAGRTVGDSIRFVFVFIWRLDISRASLPYHITSAWYWGFEGGCRFDTTEELERRGHGNPKNNMKKGKRGGASIHAHAAFSIQIPASFSLYPPRSFHPLAARAFCMGEKGEKS
jgi:hypothetical protein